MINESEIYAKFKPCSAYGAMTKPMTRKKGYNLKSFAGAAFGVGIATLGYSKLKKDQNSILYKISNMLHLKQGGQKTLFDVAQMISTASLSNIGAVALNSSGKTREQKKAKWKEARFQIMNMAIPMLMVTTAIKTCEASKVLNKVPTKIVASAAAMVSGAFLATQINNMTKKENEPKRKYTIKDSIANFDDIVATIKLGFSEVERYIPVSKILPFIYIYSGARAGIKGDND